MIPLLKRIVRAFLFDELAATRWIRGSLLLASASGVAFADQIAGILGPEHPTAIKVIKAVAVSLGFLAGAITAGEKNPPQPVA